MLARTSKLCLFPTQSPVFYACFLLILALNRNLGLNPSSDIRIDRLKSLNRFFSISKAFLSSESEFVKVRFFKSVSCSTWPKIVIWP